MLELTKLAVALKPDYLAQLEALGQVVVVPPRETLYQVQGSSAEMHVVIEGDINLYKEGQDLPVVWLGPGDILGEIGFILRTPRTTAARAGTQGAKLWRLDRRVINDRMDEGQMELMTRLLVGLAPYIRVRLNKLTENAPSPRDLLDTHCDHRHPAIQHMAEFLIGRDTWETAHTIWEFVSSLPYRIGFWNIRASRTLQLGYGMSTTKTNLHVALLRACEIDAAFGEVECPPDLMNPLIHPGYHHVMASLPRIMHYVPLFQAGGEWFPCDATFPPAVWQALAGDAVSSSFEPGEPCNPVNILLGNPARQYRRCDDLKHVITKRPFYDADNVEAMNIVLDKIQGPFLPIPEWVVPIHYLMQRDLRAAFRRAYAGIVTELERLYAAISTPRGESGSADQKAAAL